MNIFQLDQLGERLLRLDQDGELFNCTAQLVMAAVAYRLRSQENEADLHRALGAALAPFIRDLDSP